MSGGSYPTAQSFLLGFTALHNPYPAAGGNIRGVRVDANGRLEVVIPAGVPLGVDLQQVASHPALHYLSGANAALGVAGMETDDAALLGGVFPVGGRYRADITGDPLDDLDIGLLLLDVNRRLRVVGSALDDAPADATAAPLKIGGVAVQVLAAISAAGDAAGFITDMYRRLYVRSAAYDEVSGTDRGSVNTIADDRDEGAQVWAADTNIAAATNYYPSSAGYEVGNRDHLTLMLVMTDTTTTIQVSNDGTTWLDVTPSVLDMASGTYMNVSFPTGAGLSANWMIDMERVNARYVRCAVVTVDNSNSISIKVMTRKA